MFSFPNGRYELILQSDDGNLVLYDRSTTGTMPQQILDLQQQILDLQQEPSELMN